MRSIARLASLVAALAVGSAAQARDLAVDPLFGLRFDPATVRFEPAPASLKTACPKLVNARYDQDLLAFGKWSGDGVDYWLLGGFYVQRVGHRRMADNTGAIAVLKAGACTLLGPAREVFDYPTDGIGQPALRGLASDAVKRYDRAFAAKGGLAKILRRQKIRLDDPRSSILRKAVAPG